MKNTKHLKRISTLLYTLFIVTMIILLMNPIQVHAKTSLIQAIVDSISANSTAGNQTVQNGINVNRTGYLVYLLTTEGGEVYGSNGRAKVYALKPTGSNNWIGGNWLCKPRKGYQNNSASYWSNPKGEWWNMTPWHLEGGDPKTNEGDIKAWMLEDNGAGTEKVVAFVANMWEDDGITEQFSNNQIVLVVETILNLQFSTSSKGISDAEANELAAKAINRYMGKHSLEQIMSHLQNNEAAEEIENLNNLYTSYNIAKDSGNYPKVMAARSKLDKAVRNYLNKSKGEIAKKIKESDTSSKYELQGSPVYGTLNNLAEYKQSVLHLEKSALDSYTNKYACFAEYIEQGGIGEQVGFTAWNGAPSNSNISNSDVMAYGLGMMVIQANSGSASTHTWDHPLDKVIPITTNISNSAIMTYGLGLIIIFD